jgi:hypothetical protein
MPDVIRIQVIFTETDPTHGEYRDALYYTQEEWAALTPGELDAAKAARVAAWVYTLEHPSPPPPAPPVRIYSKFGFRSLMTLDEQLAADNFDLSEAPAEAKAMMRTLMVNFTVADEIDLDDPATIMGVNALEQLGVLAAGRAAQILGA